jgi:hypothetical protein
MRQAGARWRSWLPRLLALVVSLGSLGILTWAVFACFAIRRRSRSLAAATAGYLALLAVFFALYRPSRAEKSPHLSDLVGMLVLFLILAGGTVHIAVLGGGNRERPPRDPPTRESRP